MTNICHFCYTIYDLTKNYNKVVLNISFEERLLMVLSIMIKMKHTQFKTRVQKPCPTYEQNSQNRKKDTLFMTNLVFKAFAVFRGNN